MKRMLSISITILIFFVNSCSYRSTSLIGEWGLEWSFLNGVKDMEEQSIKWVFFEDGTFIQSITTSFESEDLKGRWNYEKETSMLALNYSVNNTTVLWEITNFNNNELELNYETPGFFVERKFIRL